MVKNEKIQFRSKQDVDEREAIISSLAEIGEKIANTLEEQGWPANHCRPSTFIDRDEVVRRRWWGEQEILVPQRSIVSRAFRLSLVPDLWIMHDGRYGESTNAPNTHRLFNLENLTLPVLKTLNAQASIVLIALS